MEKKILILGLILLVAGCAQPDQVQPDPENNNMEENPNLVENEPNINTENEGVDEVVVVEQGDTIKVEYVGTHADTGEEFDKSAGRGPLEFVAGAGQMIAGFDKAVIGMKLNEEKTVELPPEDAYGLSGPHPLAGKTLKFWIKVVEIQKK